MNLSMWHLGTRCYKRSLVAEMQVPMPKAANYENLQVCETVDGRFNLTPSSFYSPFIVALHVFQVCV